METESVDSRWIARSARTLWLQERKLVVPLLTVPTGETERPVSKVLERFNGVQRRSPTKESIYSPVTW